MMRPYPESDVNDTCPKYAAAERWVTRHLGKTRHEQRVASIASNLFDLTRQLHGLSPASRRLLRLGAMIHDVGRCLSKGEHPSDGAEMLQSDTTLPLTPAERRALAYMTLYHRGPVPDLRRDDVLCRADDAERLRLLLAVLRSADALDSRSVEPAQLVFALGGLKLSTGHTPLRVTCYLESDCAKARKVYRRRKKFRLLEELLDVRVDVEIDRAEGLRLVA
jgi:exopolyphosphatase/guanosine-5'-triphosphate,3'-diphosphate pyrophosphatase